MNIMHEGNKLARFARWDGGTGCYNIILFPLLQDLKDVPVDDIAEFIAILRSEHTLFQGEAAMQVNRFWMDLGIELISRIDVGDLALREDRLPDPVEITIKTGDKEEMIIIEAVNKNEDMKAIHDCIAETIRANYNAIN